MEKREVTFDDINPFDKSIDPLTTRDEVKRELAQLQASIDKRKAEKDKAEKQKAEAEAEEKRLNEIKAQAQKLIEEQKAEN